MTNSTYATTSKHCDNGWTDTYGQTLGCPNIGITDVNGEWICGNCALITELRGIHEALVAANDAADTRADDFAVIARNLVSAVEDVAVALRPAPWYYRLRYRLTRHRKGTDHV